MSSTRSTKAVRVGRAALLGLVVTIAAMSQDAPKLKPEVALAIRNLQLQRSENQTRLLVLQAQAFDAQQTVKNLDVQIAEKLKTALQDSGLDPEKYLLESRTLEVQPRPKIPGRADDAK